MGATILPIWATSVSVRRLVAQVGPGPMTSLADRTWRTAEWWRDRCERGEVDVLSVEGP
jgi:hypothetical protein